MQKFTGQGWNSCHSSNLSHISENIRELYHEILIKLKKIQEVLIAGYNINILKAIPLCNRKRIEGNFFSIKNENFKIQIIFKDL